MWALARFCAPWVPDAGEKGKNALDKSRKAFGAPGFGTTSRSWQPAKAILFLLAWQFFAVPKACQSPRARCQPGFPHRCATGLAPLRGFCGDHSPRGPRRPAYMRGLISSPAGVGFGHSLRGLSAVSASSAVIAGHAGRDAPPTRGSAFGETGMDGASRGWCEMPRLLLMRRLMPSGACGRAPGGRQPGGGRWPARAR